MNTSKMELQNFDILKQIEPSANSSTIYNDQLLEGPIDAGKYIVGPTNTDDVIEINLEDKIRPDLLDVIVPAAK